MIGLIISASVSVFIFSALLFKNLKHRIVCYKYLKLIPQKVSIYKSTVFSNDNVDFIIIPNSCIDIVSSRYHLKLNFACADKFICNPNSCTMFINNFEIKITSSSIFIRGIGEFKFSISKPNCQYFYNSIKKEFTIEKDIINFKNFESVEISGSEDLSFKCDINDYAFLDFSSFNFDKVSIFRKNEVLRKYFGYYDTDDWESIPDFKATNKQTDLLKFNYQKQLLLPANKKICIINAIFSEAIWQDDGLLLYNKVLINIDKLGFSQLIRIKKNKTGIRLIDLLSGFEVIIKAGKDVNYQRYCFFNTNYLLIYAQSKINAEVVFLPRFLCNVSLKVNLIKGYNLGIPNIQSFMSYLYNINRLLLHGVFIDVYKMYKILKSRFLNSDIQFMLCHTLLNYINVFARYELLLIKDVRLFLEKNLKYALKNLSVRKYIFLKRALPLIVNSKMSDIVLDTILDLKDKFSVEEYEFCLTERIGLRLSNGKLFLEPRKQELFNLSIWVAGHKINLSKKGCGVNLKIDGIIMRGVQFIDLSKYPSEFNIEFV